MNLNQLQEVKEDLAQQDNSMVKLTIQEYIKICEEVRTTKSYNTGKRAYDYVFQKYKKHFQSFEHFLKVVQVYAVFFSSQGETTKEIREKTVFKYVKTND